jgi:hypothetical protein
MNRPKPNSVVCLGQFKGGEIEPGTFHGGEIEPGVFHQPEQKDRRGQTADKEPPEADAETMTLEENGSAETEDDHSSQGHADEH